MTVKSSLSINRQPAWLRSFRAGSEGTREAFGFCPAPRGGIAGFQQLFEKRTDLSFRTAEGGEESAFSLAFSEMQMPRSARHDSEVQSFNKPPAGLVVLVQGGFRRDPPAFRFLPRPAGRYRRLLAGLVFQISNFEWLC